MTTCVACAAENPVAARFCMSCGAALEAACRSCGTPLPPSAAFCMACGARVGTAPAAAPAPATPEGLRRFVPAELLEKLEYAARSGGMSGERRTVTMLFCDVAGSTAAAGTLDPEEWADIMNGAFEHLIAPVYRYEGTLARLMGDAILAFFGAPIGHEDDPERAVRAGLEIVSGIGPYRDRVCRDWGIDFGVRVGINTGLVVVGAVGSDLRVEYTAMGDAVNLAARMEQTAAAGTVRVTAETRRLVEGLFEFEELGDIEVKGMPDPVPAYRVLRPLPRPETTRGIAGLTSPLVGRDAELGELVGVIRGVAATGRGTVVSVVGEAGLGKSRLVAEARSALAEAGEAPEWHEARSLSYETALPYAPVRRLLRSLAGLGDDALPAEIRSKLEDLAATAVPGHQVALTPFLCWLLDVEPDPATAHRISFLQPPQLRAGAFDAVARVVAGIAATRPLVIGFEDLHWADDASVDLLLDLLPLIDEAMLAVVLRYRPRRGEGSWRVHEAAQRDHSHAHILIELQPLGAEHTGELVANLLAVDGLSPALRNLILDKSEGNPFYLEEIIRWMIDRGAVAREGERWVATPGAVDFAVPDSLAALLTSRLDALDEAPRRVAQAAAVVGRQFRYDEVAAVADDVTALDGSLSDLVRRDLLREVTRIPKRVYRFKHALTQEAAYGTLLLKNRVRLHAAVADFLITTQSERVGDIADHLVRARQMERAVPYLVAAGEEAARSYANEAAVARLEQAVAAIDDDTPGDLVRRAFQTLGQSRESLFDFAGAEEAYERLVTEGERRGDIGMKISGINKAGLLRGFILGRRLPSLDELGVAEALAREASDEEGLLEACMYQCMLRTGAAEFDMVEHYMQQMMDIGRDIDALEPQLFGMVHLANTLAFMTRFDDALPAAERALAAVREAGHLRFEAELLTFTFPVCHLRNGDLAAAVESVERGMEIALAIGDRESELFAAVLQGKLASARGHLEDALALSRRARAAGDATGIPYLQALGACVTGTCFLEIGGPAVEDARAHHREALELMELPTGTIAGAWLWTEIGHCALAVGKVAEAAALFERALTQPTMPMWLIRPSTLAGVVGVALAEGRVDDAAAASAELEQYVTERSMHDQYPLAAMVAGRVAAAAGDHESALTRFGEVAEMIGGGGMLRLERDLAAARIPSLMALGHDEEASAARVEVRRLSEEMAARIGDEGLRTALLTGAPTLPAPA